MSMQKNLFENEGKSACNSWWCANLCQDSINVFCQVSISVFCQVGIGVFCLIDLSDIIRGSSRHASSSTPPPHTCVFARRLILRRRDENHRLLSWSSGWQPHPFESVGQQLCKWCFLFWLWKMCEGLRRLSIYLLPLILLFGMNKSFQLCCYKMTITNWGNQVVPNFHQDVFPSFLTKQNKFVERIKVDCSQRGTLRTHYAVLI